MRRFIHLPVQCVLFKMGLNFKATLDPPRATLVETSICPLNESSWLVSSRSLPSYWNSKALRIYFKQWTRKYKHSINIHKPKNPTGLVACQESGVDSRDVVGWYVCVTNQAFQDLVCSMIGWCTNQYPTTLPTLSRGRHSRDNELHQEWSLSRARRTLYHGKWFLQAPLHCQLLLLIQPSVLNPCRRPSHYLAYLRRYQFQKNKEVTTDLERT